jgi:hypothetical protein
MTDFPKINKVQVEPVQPEASDKRVLAYRTQQSKEAMKPVVWVVRVALDKLPEPTGLGLELLVGDVPVRKYSPVEDGICFTVSGASELQSLSGGELGWRFPGDDTIHRTGVFLESGDPDQVDPNSLRLKTEALSGKI